MSERSEGARVDVCVSHCVAQKDDRRGGGGGRGVKERKFKC